MGTDSILWLLWKDFNIELRRKFEIIASLGFIIASSIIVGLIASVSLNPLSINLGGFWVIVIFVSIFNTTTAFIRESEKKTIYGLRLIPVSPSLLFISKTVYILFLIILQGLFCLLLISFFSNFWQMLSYKHVILFLLFSPYISSAASFSSALVMYSEGKSLLLPLVTLVFISPILPALINLSFSMVITVIDIISLVIEDIVILIVASVLSDFILSV